jgi:DNA-binding MarR family transcriptional regulator
MIKKDGLTQGDNFEPEDKFLVLSEEIQKLLSQMAKKIRRDLEKKLAQAGGDISFLGFGVLHFLILESEQTIKDLSDKTMLAPATLVPVVDGLEKKGLVLRQADKTDRRRNQLILTAKAKKLMANLSGCGRQSFLAAKLQKLGYKKSQNLIEVLRELVASTDNKK